MKDNESTVDSVRKCRSEIGSFWDVSSEGCQIRFSIDKNYLSVNIISINDFRYYFRMFEIDQVSDANPDKVPEAVVEKGLASKYQLFSFKNGNLTLEYGHEFNRYKQKYCFGKLRKLELNGQLFEEITAFRRVQKELWLAKIRIRGLQSEKKIVMKELKKVNAEKLREDKRLMQKEDIQLYEAQIAKPGLATRFVEGKKKMMSFLQSKIGGDSVVMMILLGFLAWILLLK